MRYSSTEEIKKNNVDGKYNGKTGQVFIKMPKGEMPYGDPKSLNKFGLEDLSGYMTGAGALYPQEEKWIKIL